VNALSSLDLHYTALRSRRTFSTPTCDKPRLDPRRGLLNGPLLPEDERRRYPQRGRLRRRRRDGDLQQNSCGRAPPKIYLIAGGFHLVTAPDDTIAKTVAALKDTFKVENVAPGHCTGEPTFAALKQAFRTRYIYAGVGTSLPLGQSTGPGERRGDGPVLEDDDLTTYRKLARREDPFGVRSRSLR